MHVLTLRSVPKEDFDYKFKVPDQAGTVSAVSDAQVGATLTLCNIVLVSQVCDDALLCVRLTIRLNLSRPATIATSTVTWVKLTRSIEHPSDSPRLIGTSRCPRRIRSVLDRLLLASSLTSSLIDDHDPQKSLYDIDNDSTVITLGDWYVSLRYTSSLCN